MIHQFELVEKMNIYIFIALLCGIGVVSAVNGKVVMCYYGTWATYRWGLGKFDVDNVNPELCTHAIYTFAGITAAGTVVSLDPFLDLPSGRNNFKKFTSLKTKNPNLKTLLAIGGWNEGSAKYSIMVASPTLRNNFIQSALQMVLDYGFDGLDIDWEYPNRRDTVHGSADVDNFSQLLKELREVFDQHGLLMTAAVSSVEQMAATSYDVPTIAKYLDYINLMTYDMYGAWDAVTGHNAPLYRGEGDDGVPNEELYTVELAVQFWLGAGCPPEKLVLGVPFYGRSFTLVNPELNNVRAPSAGAGIAGPYTVTNGFLGYNEVCNKLRTETWTVHRDELAKVPYATLNYNWISYDDPESITAKVEYANRLNLAGIMVWSIETDDFYGLCGAGQFPLLTAINRALGNENDNDVSPPTQAISSEPTTASSTVVDPSTATSSEESTSSTTTSTEASVPVVPTEPASSKCTKEGFIANEEDCSKYYVCIKVNGDLVPIKFSCPSQLLWDWRNNLCNYAELVDCSS